MVPAPRVDIALAGQRQHVILPDCDLAHARHFGQPNPFRRKPHLRTAVAELPVPVAAPGPHLPGGGQRNGEIGAPLHVDRARGQLDGNRVQRPGDIADPQTGGVVVTPAVPAGGYLRIVGCHVCCSFCQAWANCNGLDARGEERPRVAAARQGGKYGRLSDGR